MYMVRNLTEVCTLYMETLLTDEDYTANAKVHEYPPYIHKVKYKDCPNSTGDKT